MCVVLSFPFDPAEISESNSRNAGELDLNACALSLCSHSVQHHIIQFTDLWVLSITNLALFNPDVFSREYNRSDT